MNYFDNENSCSVKIKRKGIVYLIKKLFHGLPFETNIKTASGAYDVEIKISQKQMKKIVDKICNGIIESIL